MFLGGPRLKTVFASRWRALWFSCAVLATAYCSVPSPEETAADAASSKVAASKSQAAKWWAPDKPADHHS